MEQLDSNWVDFNEIWYLNIFRKSFENSLIKIHKNNGTLREDQCTFFYHISLNFHRMRNSSDEFVEKKHILPFILLFSRKSCLLRDNVMKYSKPGRPQMTMWRMRFACWISKATNIHSKYVILAAFPLRQRLNERASMWCYTHIACLSKFYFSCLCILNVDCLYVSVPFLLCSLTL